MTRKPAMPARTLKALKASIKKWRGNALGKHKKIAWRDCPLCVLYINNACLGCPVREKTKQRYCMGTPYKRAAKATHISTKAFRAAAKRERIFLEGLLPKEERK